MAGIFPSNGVPPEETQGAAQDLRLTAGCEDLFYAMRCNPRLDPVAMNRLISEIVHAVNGSCSCEESEGIEYNCTSDTNLCRAIREHITDYLFRCCLPATFPVADGCNLTQLVLSTDEDGCSRLARFDAASSEIATFGSCSVHTPTDPQTGPPNPTDQSTYYSFNDLNADNQSNTIDQTKLNRTILARNTITLTCATRVDINANGGAVFEPSVDGGVGRLTSVVLRIDGQFATSDGTNIATFTSFSNFERSWSGSNTRTLSVGTHTIEFFAVRTGPQNAARYTQICTPTGAQSTIVNLRRAL